MSIPTEAEVRASLARMDELHPQVLKIVDNELGTVSRITMQKWMLACNEAFEMGARVAEHGTNRLKLEIEKTARLERELEELRHKFH